MSDWRVLTAIGCIGVACYAMRAGGFLAASLIPAGGPVQRFLRLAPGNLFVAFVAYGCLAGGAPNIAGSFFALATVAITRREWAALIAGFAGAAATAALVG